MLEFNRAEFRQVALFSIRFKDFIVTKVSGLPSHSALPNFLILDIQWPHLTHFA